MERMTRRLVSGTADYDYPKDCFYNDGTSDRIAQSAFRQNAIERLAAYEDTGLTPESCAEFARADAEGRYIVMRDAEQEGVARLRELAKADKAGRVVVLPHENREWKKALSILDKKYAEAKKMPCIRTPLAWALYHTWREFDDGKRCD